MTLVRLASHPKWRWLGRPRLIIRGGLISADTKFHPRISIDVPRLLRMLSTPPLPEITK